MDAVDDVGVGGDAVAVGEGEDGVEVHRGAQLGHPGHDDLLGRALLEEGRGDLADRLAGAALAHADQHDAVADGMHVAALEGGQAPVLLGIAPPDRSTPTKSGWKLVDRLHEQGLVVPGGPVERVEGHAAVDPAGGVAGVEGVGQRRHAGTRGTPVRLAGQREVAGRGRRRAGRRWTARRSGNSASSPRLERVEEGAGVGDQAEPDLVGDDLAVEQPRPRLGDAPASRPAGRAARRTSTPRSRILVMKSTWSRWAFSHPHHVVEQQVVAVGRGQPLVREARARRPAPCAACRPRSGRRRSPPLRSCATLLTG